MGRHRCNTMRQIPFPSGMKWCVCDCGFIQFCPAMAVLMCICQHTCVNGVCAAVWVG